MAARQPGKQRAHGSARGRERRICLVRRPPRGRKVMGRHGTRPRRNRQAQGGESPSPVSGSRCRVDGCLTFRTRRRASSRHAAFRRARFPAALRRYPRPHSSPPDRIRHATCAPLFKQLFFVLRIAIAWGLVVMLVASLYSSLPPIGRFDFPMVLAGMATMALVVTGAFSHLHRVRLIAGRTDADALSNRQKRLVEIRSSRATPSTCWKRRSANCPASSRCSPRATACRSRPRSRARAPTANIRCGAGTRCCGSACRATSCRRR